MFDIKDYIISECKRHYTEDNLSEAVSLCLFKLYQHPFFEKEYELFTLIYDKKQNGFFIHQPEFDNRLGATNRILPSHDFIFNIEQDQLDCLFGTKKENIIKKDRYSCFVSDESRKAVKKYQEIIFKSNNIEDYFDNVEKAIEENERFFYLVENTLFFFKDEKKENLLRYYFEKKRPLTKKDLESIDATEYNKNFYKHKMTHCNLQSRNNKEKESTKIDFLKRKETELLKTKTILLNDFEELFNLEPNLKDIVEKAIKAFSLEKKQENYFVYDEIDLINNIEDSQDLLSKHNYNITSIYNKDSFYRTTFEEQLISQNDIFIFERRIIDKKGYIITLRNENESIASAVVFGDASCIDKNKQERIDCLHYLFVSDKYKNKGYCKKLIKEIAKRTKKRNKNLVIEETGSEKFGLFLDRAIEEVRKEHFIIPLTRSQKRRNIEEEYFKTIGQDKNIKKVYKDNFLYSASIDFNDTILRKTETQKYSPKEYENLFYFIYDKLIYSKEKKLEECSNKEETQEALLNSPEEHFYLSMEIDNIVKQYEVNEEKNKIKSYVNNNNKRRTQTL